MVWRGSRFDSCPSRTRYGEICPGPTASPTGGISPTPRSISSLLGSPSHWKRKSIFAAVFCDLSDRSEIEKLILSLEDLKAFIDPQIRSELTEFVAA